MGFLEEKLGIRSSRELAYFLLFLSLFAGAYASFLAMLYLGKITLAGRVPPIWTFPAWVVKRWIAVISMSIWVVFWLGVFRATYFRFERSMRRRRGMLNAESRERL